MANQLKKVYSATTQTVIDTNTDIANGNFSGAPSAEFSNSELFPYARVVASFPDWGAAPTAQSVVSLWEVKKNVDSTSDDTDAPSGTAQNGARQVGVFVLSATDALQRRTIVIDTDSDADYYLKNESGQNMNNDGGTNCIVKITPFTFEPSI